LGVKKAKDEKGVAKFQKVIGDRHLEPLILRGKSHSRNKGE